MAIIISGENNNDKILASDGVIDSLSGFNLVGVMTATSFTGDLTGDVTGNVTGNINNSTLLLQTGGTERVRIDSSGNVNIGSNTSSNPFTYLRFGASLYGAADIRPTDESSHKVGLAFYTDGTQDASINPLERVRIASDGKVGISEDDPQALLHLNDGANSAIMFGNTTHGYKIRANVTGSNDYGILIEDEDGVDLYRAVSSTGTSNANTHTFFGTGGEEIVRFNSSSTELIRISGPVDSSTQQEFGIGIAVNDAHTHPAAKITFRETDASDSRGHLLFYTRGVNSDSAPGERLRITSSGRVGISTANVHRILHVNDTVGGGIGINGTTSGIQFGTVSMAGASYNAILNRAGADDDHITGSEAGDLCLAPEKEGAFILGLSPHLGAMTTGLRIDRLRNFDFYFNSQIKLNTGSPASPSEKLRIKSNGIIVIGNNGTTFGNAAVQSFIAHGNTAGESGFSSVDTTSVAEGVGGEIAFHGKYNTGAQDYAYFGHIRGTKENATAGNTACALKFFTRPNATAPQERLRIASDGQVRMNTSGDPQADLHVGGTSESLNAYFQTSRGSGAYHHYAIGNSGASLGYIGSAGHISSSGSSTGFAFRSEGHLEFCSGGSTERVRIASAGKVTMTSTTNNQRGLAVIAPKTQINFGTTADKGGFLMSETNGQFGISGGAYWTGSNWTAVHTGSAQIRHDGSGQLVLCTNTGLTVGSNFTPSSKLRITATNVQLEQDIRLESKPNSTWGAGFNIGGNGQGTSSTHASCVVTNGNIHIDPRNGSYGTYLNWYSGGNGVYFGTSNSSQAGRIDASGNLSLSGSYPGSDLRLKENIENISGATDTIKSLVGKTFTWKTGTGLDDWKHYGFIAQEVQKVAPDLVKDNGCHYFDKDDKLVTSFDPTESDEDRKNKGFTQSLTVNNEGVIPILVEAMKDLIAKVETLEAEVATLKSS